MKNVNYATKNYKKFDVIGPYVLIERFENEEHKVGDIIIPDSKKYANNKMGVGKIIDIGKVAKEKSNLDIDDFVLYDFYSAFHDSKINVLVNYENIFMKIDKIEAKMFLNGNLF